jgi:hypothetical protein
VIPIRTAWVSAGLAVEPSSVRLPGSTFPTSRRNFASASSATTLNGVSPCTSPLMVMFGVNPSPAGGRSATNAAVGDPTASGGTERHPGGSENSIGTGIVVAIA